MRPGRPEAVLAKCLELFVSAAGAIYLREAGAKLLALVILETAVVGWLGWSKLRMLLRVRRRRCAAACPPHRAAAAVQPALRPTHSGASPTAATTDCKPSYESTSPTINITAAAGRNVAGAIQARTPAAGATVRLISSLDLTAADVQRLQSELAGGPGNSFVCLQLATMAREQMAAVAAATARGHAPALLAAAGVWFALLEVGGQLVAGGLLYPRSHAAGMPAPSQAAGTAGRGSNDSRPCQASVPSVAPEREGAGPQDPHCYIELLCTCQPGQGWGSLLLRRMEQHAARHAGGALAVGGRPSTSVRLLSVGSAQAFYRRRGYSGPDERHEMCKLLHGVPV